MRLINKLRPIKKNNKTCSIGLFLCPYCDNEVIKDLCNGRKAQSCGCMRIELAARKRRIHMESHSHLYHVWAGMKKRCYNPKDTAYQYYGGRGITVCDQWKNNYVIFSLWAKTKGYKHGLFIDRKDYNKGYDPANCRFLNKLDSNLNKRGIILNSNTASQIRGMYSCGQYTYKKLGSIFGVSFQTIGMIIQNKIWNHNGGTA